ncbi:MAG: hypothetical protein U9P90_02185 [Patescibacteria group bacterium]|nr:hypothetical protein [Patescibacteria group bacterium]
MNLSVQDVLDIFQRFHKFIAEIHGKKQADAVMQLSFNAFSTEKQNNNSVLSVMRDKSMDLPLQPRRHTGKLSPEEYRKIELIN